MWAETSAPRSLILLKKEYFYLLSQEAELPVRRRLVGPLSGFFRRCLCILLFLGARQRSRLCAQGGF